MKKRRVFLGALVLMGVLFAGTGCKPGEPLAAFSALPTTGEAPLTVQFTDMSQIEKASKIITWTWDFGDGSSSSESNPVHTYAEAGWFTVSLTVVSTDGKTNTSIQRDCVVVTLKALPLEEAVQSLVTEGTDPLEAADEFFASFTELSNEVGHEAAHEAMLAAMEAYVDAGGDYDDFTAQSRKIPPHEYGQEAVAKRRMARAYAKANGIASLDEALSRMEGAGLLSAEKTDKAGFSTGGRNNVIFVNGINTSYSECVADLDALATKIRPLAGTYQIHCFAVYNPDSLLSLRECTIQKIQELTGRVEQTAVDSATTQNIHGSIKAKTNAGNHVTMVPHSQGNFHVREAILLAGDSDRGRTSVIETGSPVTSMPQGLRNHSRVDVEGDCVTSFSGVANAPFPYEGAWGWGSWLLSRFGQIAEAIVTCLNSHSFRGSYLQGQAGNAIYERVGDYAVLPPAVSSYSINGTASSTTTRNVTLNNTCAGSPVEYMASESSGFTGAVWQPYSTAPSFTLSSGNGTKTVYFRVRNSAGTSTASSDTITLNESTVTAPTVSSFSVNGGVSSTATRNVTLNNTCAGSPVEYMASESFGFTGAVWQAYSVAPSFTLSSGNGTKTVYFQVRNSAGTSTASSDTITLNESTVIAPVVSSFSINGGASSTAMRNVTLNNTCTGSPVEYRASESSDFTGAAWLPYSAAPLFTLSSGNGTKTVYFQVRNSAGAPSAVSDTITLNESTVTIPTVSSFSINGGASSTTTRNVTLNNTCTGSPVEYRASESSGLTGAAWLPYSSAPSFTLSSGNGTKTVYFQVRNSAGTSPVVSDTIILNESTGGDTVTILLPGNVPLDLVRIPAGSFQMGSPDTERSRWSDEGPVHTVTIGYDFYMGKYEVTQGQWLAVMGSWPGTAPSSTYGVGANYPAYYVSWDDAQAFITALNTHITSTGQGPATMRLPSEAEWEYACRAGTQTRFFFGDSLGVEDYCEVDGIRSQYMWYCGNNTGSSGQPGYGTKPVGGLLPNGFGLYDMSGNLWEWCEDWWHSNYTGAPADGSAWLLNPSASPRVIRGGNWSSSARHCRSADRNSDYPSSRYGLIGFRLASVR